jgi:hypothetical protein
MFSYGLSILQIPIKVMIIILLFMNEYVWNVCAGVKMIPLVATTMILLKNEVEATA